MPRPHGRPAPSRPLLLSVCAALAGCGDDGARDETSTAPTSITLPPTSGPGPTEDPTAGDGTEVTSIGGTDGATGSTTVGETPPGPTTTAGDDTTSTGDDTTSTGAATSTGTTSSTGDESSSTTEPVDVCKVSDDMDAVVPCVDEAPPNSFEPAVQWAWMGQDGETQVLVTPVVANLTDDNADGVIDLCDTPDVVVAAYSLGFFQGSLYVLDGATGALHYKVADIGSLTYPALADIDGDGVPEILTSRPNAGSSMGWLLALEHDGAVKWQSATLFEVGSSAIATADLDNDGDVEIVLHGHVFDHNGALLWSEPGGGAQHFVNTIADLDGDDDMEVILGPTAYHHDGAPYYSVGISPGHPQVADLDADGLPEILVASQNGLSLIQHDGTLTYAGMGGTTWQPAAIHDIDGDLAPEIAAGSSSQYRVYEHDLTVKWSAPISDGSGYASSTAFDFLGDGTAEAMYADETLLYIFGGMGQPLLTSPRGSWTQWEMPIVVDVDNDASAEIVVVSNAHGNTGAPPVQVIRDVMDRWIPARRIWNQHTYHVTNVREDGTIPPVEPRSWLQFNTFRTQAQVSLGGGVCLPEPQ